MKTRQEQMQELADILRLTYSDCEQQSNEEWLKEAEAMFEWYIAGTLKRIGVKLGDEK